jgi:uncharacterized membrane protein
MRRALAIVSLAVLAAGAYLALLYDVPDSQERINFFVSWFLIIVGVGSLLANLFWTSPRR